MVGTGDIRHTVGTGDIRHTVGTGDIRHMVGTGDIRHTVGTGDIRQGLSFPNLHSGTKNNCSEGRRQSQGTEPNIRAAQVRHMNESVGQCD